MEKITNKIVKEIYDRLNGNVKKLHVALCDVAGVHIDTVNAYSLQIKARRVAHFMKT